MPGKAQRLTSCFSQSIRRRRWVTSSLPPANRTSWAAEQNRYRNTASRISKSRSVIWPGRASSGRTNFEKLCFAGPELRLPRGVRQGIFRADTDRTDSKAVQTIEAGRPIRSIAGRDSCDPKKWGYAEARCELLQDVLYKEFVDLPMPRDCLQA